jgi:hypothetical protein
MQILREEFRAEIRDLRLEIAMYTAKPLYFISPITIL